MEIFINEVSLEGQYPTETEFRNAIKVFISIFDLINQKVKDKNIYKEDSNIYANYEAIKGSHFNASLNKIRDKSLKTAFINIVFNKSNPKEWRKEQVHVPTDFFDYLTNDNDCKNVSNTTLAEVAERKLQNNDNVYLLINFINSSFKKSYPQINSCCLITIIKNNDEVNHICLDSIDTKLALEHWLEYKFRLSKLEYAYTTEPPRDEQTILRDTTRFEKTSFKFQGRIIYCELATGRYWYVDNLHFGEAAHLEVFDKTGNHLGEADLDGTIDNLKRDSNKTINLS